MKQWQCHQSFNQVLAGANGLSDNDTTGRRKKHTSAIQWKNWLMSSVDTDSHKPHTIKYNEYWILWIKRDPAHQNV